ncbi:hypothetical protein SNEBB_007266 [Seison nebaliae]|nr:hypothetical protein SNEBB_007266 [Seison nebaliae]
MQLGTILHNLEFICNQAIVTAIFSFILLILFVQMYKKYLEKRHLKKLSENDSNIDETLQNVDSTCNTFPSSLKTSNFQPNVNMNAGNYSIIDDFLDQPPESDEFGLRERLEDKIGEKTEHDKNKQSESKGTRSNRSKCPSFVNEFHELFATSISSSICGENCSEDKLDLFFKNFQKRPNNRKSKKVYMTQQPIRPNYNCTSHQVERPVECVNQRTPIQNKNINPLERNVEYEVNKNHHNYVRERPISPKPIEKVSIKSRSGHSRSKNIRENVCPPHIHENNEENQIYVRTKKGRSSQQKLSHNQHRHRYRQKSSGR